MTINLRLFSLTPSFSLPSVPNPRKINVEFNAAENYVPGSWMVTDRESNGFVEFDSEVMYKVLGWTACLSWTTAAYPQVISNFRRKSVVGLSFDFTVLNLTKHSYLIYNASLYFSSTIQKQYYEKYVYDEVIPVAANDVVFSANTVLLTAVTLFQILIYERGNQKVSKIAIAIVFAVWLFAAVCFFTTLPTHSWLWLISIFNSIQVIMTVIKYIPQALMNFARKSTDGFNIGNVLLDFCGGVANYAQMAMQSIDQGFWVNFNGNMGKMFYHWYLYSLTLFSCANVLCSILARSLKSLISSLWKSENHSSSLLTAHNQKMYKLCSALIIMSNSIIRAVVISKRNRDFM